MDMIVDNLNITNLVVVLTFSVLDWEKNPFWANIFQKSKLPVLAKTWYLD